MYLFILYEYKEEIWVKGKQNIDCKDLKVNVLRNYERFWNCFCEWLLPGINSDFGIESQFAIKNICV